MPTPFVKSFDEILFKLASGSYFFIDDDDGIFQRLLIQPLTRTIDNNAIVFFSIRVVDLKPEHRGKGLFAKFEAELRTNNIPIMFHDVVNLRLEQWLKRNGYRKHVEVKFDVNVSSYFLIYENGFSQKLK